MTITVEPFTTWVPSRAAPRSPVRLPQRSYSPSPVSTVLVRRPLTHDTRALHRHVTR